MAVFKHTRANGFDTNPFFLELFRDRSEFDERERQWHLAMAHAGEGTLPLRFPVYECLYLINVHSQKLVDLLDEACTWLGAEHEHRIYYQSLIQCVRAGASQDIIDFMNGIEITEEWLFERQRVNEEKKFRDPEDAYVNARQREAERAAEGLPPRVQFLDQDDPANQSASEPTPRGEHL